MDSVLAIWPWPKLGPSTYREHLSANARARVSFQMALQVFSIADSCCIPAVFSKSIYWLSAVFQAYDIGAGDTAGNKKDKYPS